MTFERREVIGMRKPDATQAARIAELEACILAHLQELSDDELNTMYYRTHKLAYLEEAMARNLEWATGMFKLSFWIIVIFLLLMLAIL